MNGYLYYNAVTYTPETPVVTIRVRNTPGTVSPGSVASWKITLSNHTDETQVVYIWLSIISDVLPPPLKPYNMLLRGKLAIPPNFTGSGTAKLKVPVNAPMGTYIVENIAGKYDYNPGSIDSFECAVVP